MKHQLDSAAISAFCESVGMMVRAGIPTDEAVELLLAGEPKKRSGPLEEALTVMQQSLLEGGGLAEAMEKTGAFPEYALEMVRAGERAGRLEDVLFRLSRYYADRQEIQDQLRVAVTYPAAMLCLIIAVLTVMLTMVLPSFGDVYRNLVGSLAESGYGYIRWAYVFCWVALGLMLALLAALVICVGIWRSGRRTGLEKAVRAVPACRAILDEMGLHRFTSAFLMFMASGDVQDEAVAKSIPMTECAPVQETLSRVLDQMDREGHSFVRAAGDQGLLEPVYSRMLLAGERSGELEDVMNRLSELLRNSYTHRVNRVVAVVDPILSGVLVLTVALSLLSMMLPLIGMMNAVG